MTATSRILNRMKALHYKHYNQRRSGCVFKHKDILYCILVKEDSRFRQHTACNMLFLRISVLILQLVNGEIIRYTCKKEATFKLYARSHQLKTFVLLSKQLSLKFCAKLCIDAPKCKSFNYNPSTKECQALLQDRIEAGNAKLAVIAGWNYYETLQEHKVNTCDFDNKAVYYLCKIYSPIGKEVVSQ